MRSRNHLPSKARVEDWASGPVHYRKYLPNENIRGGEIMIKIDFRFGMAQVLLYDTLEPWEIDRFPESKLADLQAYLEVEGITTPYYAEKIVEKIKMDIEKHAK